MEIKEKLDKKAEEIVKYIKDKTNSNPEIIFKEMTLFNTTMYVVTDEMVADKTYVDRFVLNYFANERIKNNNKQNKPSDLLKYLEETIPTHKIIRLSNYEDIFLNLFSGFAIVIIDDYDEVLSLETRAKLDSGVMPAQNEMVTKGPKDAFTENYQTNLGLIRRRIKSEKLCLKEAVVGTKSKTKVGVMYVEDIADQKLVDMVIKKIKNINIDTIFDINYVIELISENKKSLFANYISTERPDRASMSLLDGKIAIIVENTQYVAIIPAFFVEFFHSTEDFYQKVSNVNFTRIIRLIAFFIELLAPALYVAIATYNIEAIPDKLLLSFVTQRMGVPLPTVVEIILMLIVFEIIKEVDSRLPNAFGSSLSIIGAIVLGQAVISAGLVSPITIIVAAITSICGMITYNMDMNNGIRWWRFIFLILASVFGLFGVLMSGFLFLIYLTSIKSFGIPYMAPIAPFFGSMQRDAIFITNKRKFKKRNSLTAGKNIDRTETSK